MKGFIIVGLTSKGVDAIKKHQSKDRNVTPVKTCDSPYTVSFIVSGRYVRIFSDEETVRLGIKKTMRKYDCFENVDYTLEVKN